MMIRPTDKTEAIWEAAQKALKDGNKKEAERLEEIFFEEWGKEIKKVREQLPFA